MLRNLKNMPYAQAKIMEDENTIALISYTTTVIEIGKNNGWVRCYGTFSQTTRKHISAFCREMGMGLDYYLMKKIANEGLMYNVDSKVFINAETGVIVEGQHPSLFFVQFAQSFLDRSWRQCTSGFWRFVQVAQFFV